MELETTAPTKLAFENLQAGKEMELKRRNQSEGDPLLEQGKSVVHYILNPEELRYDHPSWHYFYLVVLVVAAFAALFIGPVVFGMLATFGGIGAPVVLSFVGAAVGIFAGLTFGVVFAVVGIVLLVKFVGAAADWVLHRLWDGGYDVWQHIRGYAKQISSY